MDYIALNENVPVKGKYDIIVCGGGVAGAAAALTAAREKKNVLLIEKSNILGGLSTLGHVNFFEPMCNGCGRQVVKGMAQEFLDLSVKYGYDTLHPEWKNGEPKEPTHRHYITWFSPFIFALALTDLLTNAGVKILFDTVVTAPVMDKEIIKGVVVDNKSGLTCYEGKQFIDVTGDADLIDRMGLPTVQGVNYFTFSGRLVTLDSCKEAVEKNDIRFAFKGISGGIAGQTGHGHPEGMPTFTGTSAEDVNDFIIKNQLKMFENIKKTGRTTREIASFPLMPQFRTTRHLDAEYTLTDDDLFRHFDDSIGVMGDPFINGNLFEIPFRTLCNKNAPNLLTAGRSASADGHAWNLLRIIPPAIVTGQAAGFAACQALNGDRAVYEPDINKLRDSMIASGNIVSFEDEWKNDVKKIKDGKNV